MGSTRTATCACGKLNVECDGEPVRVSLCHCLACQRRTGSTYGIAAFFLRENIRISGETKSWERPSDSGHGVLFHFCPSCGSTVHWEPRRMPERIAVAVGAFADPDFRPPTQSVYREHRHRWVDRWVGEPDES